MKMSAWCLAKHLQLLLIKKCLKQIFKACDHEGMFSIWASVCLEFMFKGPHKIKDVDITSVLC